jgi:predicted protein tyrosine phosphatase
MTAPVLKLLFICSQNRWRSPTAEAIYKRFPGMEARSAGVSPQAVVFVNENHVRWADRIFVMETRHREMLQQRFGREQLGSKVTVLDIPDDFRRMDEELIAILKERLRPHIPVPE